MLTRFGSPGAHGADETLGLVFVDLMVRTVPSLDVIVRVFRKELEAIS